VSGPYNLVRVFYRANSLSVQDRQKVITQVRTTAQIPRLFINNASGRWPCGELLGRWLLWRKRLRR
jgi:hypothetical protein